MTKPAPKAQSWDWQCMLVEIGHRLNHQKAPTETQRDFLRLFGSAVEDGLPIEQALDESMPPEKLRGKQSSVYRLAKQNRDRRIKQAFELLTGSRWSRCSQIAADLGRIRYALDHNETLHNDCYTLLLVKAIQTGIKIVTTCRGIHDILKD